jgi:hypothetical protein
MQRYGAMWATWDGPTRVMWIGVAAAAAVLGWRLVWKLTH